MQDEWLTLPQIARLLDIAESTARRWAKAFEEFLPSRGRGAHRRFAPPAVDVFQKIKVLYDAGHTTEFVREHLQAQFPTTIDAELVEEKQRRAEFEVLMRAVAEALETMRAEVREARAAAEEAQREAQELRAHLEHLERREQDRAQKLDALIQALRERNERKRSFFDRLLGR